MEHFKHNGEKVECSPNFRQLKVVVFSKISAKKATGCELPKELMWRMMMRNEGSFYLCSYSVGEIFNGFFRVRKGEESYLFKALN